MEEEQDEGEQAGEAGSWRRTERERRGVEPGSPVPLVSVACEYYCVVGGAP